MSFHYVVSVGDGWKPIVEDAICELRDYDPNIQITQIKEKFGELRIYTSYHDDRIGQIIQKAEGLCAETCELTGKPGRRRYEGKGWVKTLCDEKALEIGYTD